MEEGRERLEEDSKDKTKELIFEDIRNVDGVTGLPYETPEVRKKLIEAIGRGGNWVMVDMDVNNLKGLNDRLGHKLANEILKEFGEMKKKKTANEAEVEGFYFYRPQAGGDEYKLLARVRRKESGESLRERLREREIIRQVEVSGEVGLSMTEGKKEEGGKILQALEEEAGERLGREKLRYLDRLASQTVGKGRQMGVEEYIEFVCNNWGTRRITPEILKLILFQVKAKITKETTRR